MKEEAKGHMYTISFGKARVHIVMVSGDIAFTTQQLLVSPNSPGTSSLPIGVDCCITDNKEMGAGDKKVLKVVKVSLWADVMSQWFGPQGWWHDERGMEWLVGVEGSGGCPLLVRQGR